MTAAEEQVEEAEQRQRIRRRDRWRQFLIGPKEPGSRSVWRVSLIYWAVLIYAGFWILLRTYGIGGERLPPVSTVTVVTVFLLASVNLALRSRSAVRRGGFGAGHPDRMGWLYTILDLSIIATAVRATGGLDSGLWPVFFVVVVAESVLEPIREARYVRVGATISLIAATLPFPPTFHWFLETMTRLVFLIAVSMVAQRLRQGSDREKSENASLRSEIALIEERSRLAREVHDGVGNALAASVLRLEVTARLIEKQQAKAATDSHPITNLEETITLLKDEAQTLRGTMNEVRDWTFYNRPWKVSSEESALGMKPSDGLIAEIERLSRRTGLPVTVQGANELDSLPSPVRLAIFRITQEALTNSAKYATGATGATVTLACDEYEIVLEIEDNGAGFDPATGGTGVGMSSMRERTEGLGGHFVVESAPSKGTTIYVRLPAGQ